MKKRIELPSSLISWDSLFEMKESPRKPIRLKENILDALRVYARPYADLPEKGYGKTGFYFLYEDTSLFYAGKGAINLRGAVYDKLRRLNGSGQCLRVVLVSAPAEKMNTLWKHIDQALVRRQTENSLGQKLIQHPAPDSQFLLNCFKELTFHPLASRNAENEIGSLVLHPLPFVRYKNSGLYFIQEHAPSGDVKLVYNGVSRKTLKKRVYDHFLPRSKTNSWTESRAESRGKWIRKVKKDGYSYSVAPVAMYGSAEEHGKQPFYRKLFALERLFTELLNPRDNDPSQSSPSDLSEELLTVSAVMIDDDPF